MAPNSIIMMVSGPSWAASRSQHSSKRGRMDEACSQVTRLAEVNRQGIESEWEFNEWRHGRTGQPMGCPHQGWSAGMYIFAYRCVAKEEVTLLA